MKLNKVVIVGLALSSIGILFTLFWSTNSTCKGGKHTPSLLLSSLPNYSNIVPLAIIGSGPAGLSAAVYGARAKIHTVVIEGNKPGGLLTETTEVENWPGSVSIMGPEIISNLKKQAQHVGAEFLSESVETVDFSSWPYRLELGDGTVLHALSIIIATGSTPRRLNVTGESAYWGRGVTSCAVCDAPFFKGEEVVVVGGGDSAVEEAIQLSPYVKKVTVLVRGEKMRAAATMQDRLKGYSNIFIRYNVSIEEIVGNNTQVTGVQLLNNKTKEKELFATAGVFLAIGHDPNTTIFKDEIKLDKQGYVWLRKRSQETSVTGIFAAGDVEDFVYRQAGVAAGSGIKAALEASWFLAKSGIQEEVLATIEPRFFHVGGIERKAAVQEITNQQELAHLLEDESRRVVFLDFSAEHCPSCMQMMPAYEKVAHEAADKAAFATIDVDKSMEVAHDLLVNKIPCILVYKEGKLVGRYNQAMTHSQLKQMVEQFTV